MKAETEMSLACPAAPLACEVAPVRFTPDDDFHDHADTWDLSDCAAALLTRAGSWSARNSNNGFVPSSMLARFSSDPVQAARELVRRNVWRRVKGGYQFTDWARWGELTEDIERRRSDAAERQRKHRARKREGTEEEEPQVGEGTVTHLSRVTVCDTPIDRSDLDQSSVSRVSQSSRRNARAREPDPGTPDFRDRVRKKFAAKTGVTIDDATADDLAAEVIGSSKKPVNNALSYVFTAIKEEADPLGRWLPGPVPPAAQGKRRPHCGDSECNPGTRRREDPGTGADDGPCPKCSAPVPAWEAS
jgi:hypothetical protein